MSLNASSPIPLYRQLADRLLADIDAGTYGVDAKIPSENVLADRFSIGRPTVRQATDLLVQQGRLERRRGSGTYVKPPATAIDLLSLAGTSAALQSSELDARLELISSATLNNESRYHVQRLALVDDQPVLVENLYFDSALFNGLDQHRLENRSLSALVKEIYFLEPTAADQRFSVVLADKENGQLLQIAKKTPLLHVHRSLHFAENRDALYADIFCLTDRFDFSQTLYPTRAN